MDVEELPCFTATMHGHDIHYVKTGHGPVIVLLHGVLGSQRTWARLVRLLARDYTVLAPDLLGHGDSAKPRGDYSVGAHAATLRDLLNELGIPRATLVGHSLGGGVAMQFAYMFPERVTSLVLVSSGGLGRELSVLLRAPTLPGAEYLIPVLSSPWLRRGGEVLGRSLRRIGLRGSPDVEEVWRGYVSLGDVEVRRAFLATVRSVVDPGGQTVSGVEKMQVLADTPMLIVWGARDRLIPAWHGVLAQRALPGSRLEVFPDAGHFPHLDDPQRFVALLREFVAPASPDAEPGDAAPADAASVTALPTGPQAAAIAASSLLPVALRRTGG